MARDPLESLVRLRRFAVDNARHALADCLRAEAAAEQATADLAASVARETEAASDLATGDAEVEAFAAWLRRIRPEQEAAHLAQDAAELATTLARAALTAGRAAAQAAEDMLERKQAAARAEADRHAQRTLDETAAMRHSAASDADGDGTPGHAQHAGTQTRE